jgi:hypothetical protein
LNAFINFDMITIWADNGLGKGNRTTTPPMGLHHLEWASICSQGPKRAAEAGGRKEVGCPPGGGGGGGGGIEEAEEEVEEEVVEEVAVEEVVAVVVVEVLEEGEKAPDWESMVAPGM